MKVKILVCCHKNDIIPSQDNYMPIHVGKALHNDIDLGITGDNTGDNISIKNKNYCELTGVYWAWKNLENVDVVGLCHYRRYFDLTSTSNYDREPYVGVNDVPNVYPENIEKILQHFDVILPGNSYICDSVWDAYAIAHSRAEMVELEKAIIKRCPSYLDSFNFVMKERNFYCGCNMLICKKQLFDSYCIWLFDLLGEVEKNIDISNYDSYQARIYGFMSERLLNVFVHHNKLSVCHRPIVSLIDGKSPSRVKQILHRIKSNLCFKLKY